MHDLLIVHTDGAARGNPGPAGIGVVIASETGEVVQRIARAIGRRTNNQAEYEAVIAGLSAAHALQAKHVTLMLDSELVAKQLRGAYRIKNADLKRLSERAQALLQHFARVRIVHVPRGRNADADRLANEGVDRALP